MSASLAITFFPNFGAASKSEEVMTLGDLAGRIERTTNTSKAALPWLKLAVFGQKRTDKQSLRWDGNLIAVTGIEADYDAEQMTVDDAVEKMVAAGLEAMVYTSPSHTEDTPRWRVLCPLSRPHEKEERDRFMARLNGLFGGVFANESWTLSQSYYYGSVSNNPSHRVVLTEGLFIDQVDELDQIAIGKPEKQKAKITGTAFDGPVVPPGPIANRRVNTIITALLNNISGAADQAKHTTLRDNARAIGGWLHYTDWTDDQAVQMCIAALEKCGGEPVKDWNHAKATAYEKIADGRGEKFWLKAREPKPSPTGPNAPVIEGDPPIELPVDKPPEDGPPGGDPPPPDTVPGGQRPDKKDRDIIRCVAGELPRMAREAEAFLIKAGVEVYQRNSLVRPIEEDHEAATVDGIKRRTHTAALIAFTPASLMEALSEVIDFVKYNKREKEWVSCDAPDKLIAVLLARRGDWSFPSVRGVLTCPTIRPDGSVLRGKGYDPDSRYYMAMPNDLVLPDIPAKPNKVQARAALKRLTDLLTDFPFVDDVSKAVAVCILMTQVLRCGMECSPLLAVSANAAGTGKSFLIDLASAIALGRPCPIIPPGKNEDETEKGIRTKLLASSPAFSVDNVHVGLNMPLLNMATERTHISIRMFGVLEEVEVENSVVIYMTGNNLPIIDEQGRRTVRCQLDAMVENPEFRPFQVNPIDTVMADRGRYIADILTIARAYLTYRESGGPRPDIPPMGDSHKAWSKLVREPLVWLDMEDVIKSQAISRDSDPVTSRLEAIIEAWHAAFGTAAHTLAEAVKFATTPPVFFATSQTDIDQANYDTHKANQEGLLAALRDGFAAGKDGVNTHGLGNWLRRFEGRVCGGLKFIRAKEEDTKHKAGGKWRLSK